MIDRELPSGAAANTFAPLQASLLAWFVGSAAPTYQLINNGKLDQIPSGDQQHHHHPSTHRTSLPLWSSVSSINWQEMHRLFNHIQSPQSQPLWPSWWEYCIGCFPLSTWLGKLFHSSSLNNSIEFRLNLKLCGTDMVHRESLLKKKQQPKNGWGSNSFSNIPWCQLHPFAAHFRLG